MELFKIFGSIVIDSDGANREINNTTGNAETASTKMGKAFKGIALAVAGAFAVDKIKDFGVSMIEASATAQAVQAQFTQVFGDIEKDAVGVITKMGESFGILPTRLKAPLAQMTSMFKGLGYDTEEAMAMAERGITLVADASAFYDKSFEDTNRSLNSFIKGNYEGGEAIGLFANETQMAKFASEELGLTWKTLDEAGKQLVRLTYAEKMQEMAGATGQAKRESDGLENVLGNLKQAWQDFMAVIGEPLLESVIPILQGLTSNLVDVTEKIKGFFDTIRTDEGLLEGLKQHFSNLFSPDSLNPSAMLDGLSTMIPQILQKGMEFVQGLAEGIIANAPMIASTVVIILQTWISNLATMYPLVLNAGVTMLIALIEGIVSALPQIVNAVLVVVMTLVTTIVGLLPTIIQAGIRVIPALIEGIIQMLPTLLQTALQIVDMLVSMIITQLPLIIEMGIQLLMALIDGIIQLLPQLITTAVQLVLKLVEGIIAMLPTIVQAGIQLILALIDGIIRLIPDLISVAIDLIISLQTGLMQQVPLLISAGIQIIIALIAGIVQAIPQIVAIAPTIVSALWDGIKNVNWLSLGVSIISGIISGIKSGAGGVFSALKSALGGGGKGAKTDTKGTPAKNANGSKFFEGGQTIVGEQGRELVELPRGSRIHSNNDTENILGKKGGGTTQNIIINSPKSLNANEVARQLRKVSNQLSLQ